MQRPQLNKIDFQISDMFKMGQAVITMSSGQWDWLLQEAYDNHFLLVEMDENEMPVAGFKKPDA